MSGHMLYNKTYRSDLFVLVLQAAVPVSIEVSRTNVWGPGPVRDLTQPINVYNPTSSDLT